MTLPYRYALYLTPVGAWHKLGRQWLGRCADTAITLARPAGTDPRLDAWTREPRRYGLHATLKAPFRLRDGKLPRELDQAVRALATQHDPFGIPLRCEALRGFLAWCIHDKRARHRVNALANTAVTTLDPFRAPTTADELARRQPERLDAAHRQMLDRWGYPYVFDTFTFHITLTGTLDDDALSAARANLDALNRPALQLPMPVNAISLYVEPEPGANFIVARHYGFDGMTRDGVGAHFLSSTNVADARSNHP